MTDPARRAFEHATYHGLTSRVESISIDKHIGDILYALEQGVAPDISGLVEKAVPGNGSEGHIVEKFDPKENWTDALRYATGSSFVIERIVLPFTIGRNGSHYIRQDMANGILGKSLDLIEPALEYVDILKSTPHSTRNTLQLTQQLPHIRGWIQEMTVMALINYPQSGDLVSLPSSTIEDIEQQTDLLAYVRKRGNGYRIPISVKSTERDTATEEARYPKLCVIGAQEFGNQGLSITRLLLRQHHGHPGITEDEAERINEARRVIMSKLQAKVTEENIVHPGRQQYSPAFLGALAHALSA